jgi:hypothetical protein
LMKNLIFTCPNLKLFMAWNQCCQSQIMKNSVLFKLRYTSAIALL